MITLPSCAEILQGQQEKRRATDRRHRIANPDARKASQRRWYAKNKEYHRRWRAAKRLKSAQQDTR